MSISRLAIIGCGAAATTFLRSFVDECIEKKLSINEIIVFERRNELGSGIAYQYDLNDLLINRPIQNMSANPHRPDEFYNWMKQKHLLPENQFIEQDEPIYTSRYIFGLYLNEIFEKTILHASKHNITIRVIYDAVVNVIGTRPFIIITKLNKSFIVDAAIFCTGNNHSQDIFSLKSSPNYIHSPYPFYKTISNIYSKDSVGVIGNSLTAIDTAIALSKNGFTGKLFMLSRRYVVPHVRGIVHTHQPQFLTFHSINKILNKKGRISLRDILRLFRQELNHYNVSWKSLFTEDDLKKSFQEIIVEKLTLSANIIPWQSVIPSTNIVAEFLWNILDDSDKALFLKRFQRMWLNARSSIPPINARLLLNLANAGQLEMLSKLQKITWNNVWMKFIVKTEERNDIEVDWIINATGPSMYVQPQDELMHNMIKQGLAKENRFGGVDVDFHTTALINRQGQLNPYLRLIGHNTIGVYQYTSSLELIAKKSMHVASDFAKFTKEISNEKSTIPTFIHSDRLGHLTQIVG